MKLLRVCVAVVVAVGLFMCVGCGDNKVAGPDNSGQRHDVTGSQPLNAEWLPKSSSAGQSLAGTTWLWEAVERMTFANPSAFGDKAYTLEFKVDGTIVAYSWVNTFRGTYTVNGATYKIHFDDFVGTKVGSVEETGENEWRDTFRTVNSYELSGNDLTLFHNNGSLVYRKQSGDDQNQPLNAEWLPKSSSTGQSLAGTTWKWEAIERMTFPFPSDFGDKAYTLEFKVDGTIVAYSWVNTFRGTYTVNGATYKIHFDDFVGTEVGSVEETGENEWRGSFRTVNSYELSGNDLTLFHNNGSLVYRKQSGDTQNQALEWRLLRNGSSSQSLTGITWKLSRIVDVASGSLTTPNEGSFGNNRSYTLEFKADGTLETRSSVNTYWGTYTVEYRGGDEVYIINIADFGGTEAWDGIVGGGDDLWRTTFPAVETIYLQGSGLRLYYNNNQSYLLFHVATDAN